jgi:hypothetical protein
MNGSAHEVARAARSLARERTRARPGLVGALALALLAVAPPAAADEPAAEQGTMDALVGAKLVDPGSATAADLEAALTEAHALLVAGDATRAAARLYLVVESGRYARLAGGAAFEDAQYQLGVALTLGGATATGRRYLERLAARWGSPYAEPALRRLVDVALEERDAARAVARLAAAGVAPPDGAAADEIAYLRGRAAFDAGRDDEAETVLRHVGPRCRFYPSALYLRGVVAVRRGDLRGAQDAFCTVAEERPGDPLRFVVDGRYYTVRDLARLALARIAHEERRYDDAFYHDFTVPSDSRELPHALFEAAWSMVEAKRYPLAARLLDELGAEFPDSPLAPDARLLAATLSVKTCRFAAARRALDELVATWEPVARAVAEARKNPAAREALAARLLERQAPPVGSVEARLLALLALSPAYRSVEALARGLRDDAETAGALEAGWAALGTRIARDQPQPVSAPLDATALLEKAGALAPLVAESVERALALRDAGLEQEAQAAREVLPSLGRLEERRARLAARLRARVPQAAQHASAPRTLVGRVEQERAATALLRSRAADLGARLDARMGALLEEALAELDARLETMLRRARLGRIDALVGEKKRLEREIQDLAAGRFPPSLADRLSIEGLIGDDEEYWPPEPEHWADEYEGYR